jgi:hypothetical protein
LAMRVCSLARGGCCANTGATLHEALVGSRARSSSALSVAAGSGSNAATAAMCAWFVWRAVRSLSSARAALQLRTSLAQAASQSAPVWKVVVPCLVVS